VRAEWEKQERRIAKRRKGTLNAGSGSGWRRKQDVRETGILWEAKQTHGISISVKKSVWTGLRKNALMEGRMPALHLQIQDVALVVIAEDDFDERFPTMEDDPDRSGR